MFASLKYLVRNLEEVLGLTGLDFSGNVCEDRYALNCKAGEAVGVVINTTIAGDGRVMH